MKRVLVVDGHNVFRQALAVDLEQHTDLKAILQAGSPGEARRVLAELGSRVDLAVIDLDLPEGGATELIEHLRAEDVPVLALTANRSLEWRARALRAGASEVLTMELVGEFTVASRTSYFPLWMVVPFNTSTRPGWLPGPTPVP